MTEATGKFVWYDAMTTDVSAAAAFYSAVVGWTAADSGMPGQSYTILSHGETMVAGLMPTPDDVAAAGEKPRWLGYIGVDDVDAYAKKVEAAGGSIHKPPTDIPDIGRFAVAADPHGALFYLFTPLGGTPAEPTPMGTPGHVSWQELMAGDLDQDWAFYSGLFGWSKVDALDMGEHGIYQTFSYGAGQQAIGGMMTRGPETPSPTWRFYFGVEGIDAAVARTAENGGTITFGPVQVPGGDWVVMGVDPQGAQFCLLSSTK